MGHRNQYITLLVLEELAAEWGTKRYANQEFQCRNGMVGTVVVVEQSAGEFKKVSS